MNRVANAEVDIQRLAEKYRTSNPPEWSEMPRAFLGIFMCSALRMTIEFFFKPLDWFEGTFMHRSKK